MAPPPALCWQIGCAEALDKQGMRWSCSAAAWMW